jgi:hypothetical protein
MRTEAILVLVLVAATPADASKSCMTRTEARQQFATSHLYWHGAGHCWDAMAPRHRLVHVRQREDRPASQDHRDAGPGEPKWRSAMSEMLSADAITDAPAEPAIVAAEDQPRINWTDRWVDVVPVASPAIFSRKDGADAMPATAAFVEGIAITPVRLFLLLLVFVLAAIGLLFRNLLYDLRR